MAAEVLKTPTFKTFYKLTVSRRKFLRCMRSSILKSSSSYLMSSGENVSNVEPLISFAVNGGKTGKTVTS